METPDELKGCFTANGGPMSDREIREKMLAIRVATRIAAWQRRIAKRTVLRFTN